MGQESKNGLAGVSVSGSPKAETKMLAGAVVSSEAQRGRDLPLSSLCYRIHFLVAAGPKTSSSCCL